MVDDDEGRVLRMPDGTQVVISSRTDGAMEAVVAGRLSITDSVLTLTGSSAIPAVLLLPHDTTVLAADPLTLRVAGRTLRIGDRVDGGGGDVSQGSPLMPRELPSVAAGWHVTALQTLG